MTWTVDSVEGRPVDPEVPGAVKDLEKSVAALGEAVRDEIYRLPWDEFRLTGKSGDKWIVVEIYQRGCLQRRFSFHADQVHTVLAVVDVYGSQTVKVYSTGSEPVEVAWSWAAPLADLLVESIKAEVTLRRTR